MKKTTTNNNIKVIVNSKGGVGKSVIAKILGALAVESKKFNKINIYEIDNNNAKSDLKSEFINHKVFKINDKNEAIFDVAFNEDENEILSIIDSGGGDDSLAVIESLAKNNILNVDFFIPTLNDIETIENVLATCRNIKKYFKDSNITLVLNKVSSLEKYKDEFISIFGNEKYGVSDSLDLLNDYINNIAIVPQSDNIIYMLKGVYKTEFADMLLSAKDIIENEVAYRKLWKEKGDRAYFDKQMEIRGFGVDLINFIDDCNKTLKV